MPLPVVNAAELVCTFGSSPSSLTVRPTNQSAAEGQPAATIIDHVPMVNIMPFGICASPANPQVAAATFAALGVLTPQPCIPATSSPWTQGSPLTRIASRPALDNVSTCQCNWGAVITITDPGQSTKSIP